MPHRLGLVILIAVLAIAGWGGPAAAVEVGKKAPDFTLTGPGNKPVTLNDLLGKGPVVIYTVIHAFSAT
jgi:hypothetical protein